MQGLSCAYNIASQSDFSMQLRVYRWEKGLKDEIRRMCKVDPLTHKEYTDGDKAQTAACACDAHLDYYASAAAFKKSKNHPSPSSAYAKVDNKKTKFTALLPFSKRSEPSPGAQLLRWTGNTTDLFSVPTTPGRLAEPVPEFFQDWIDARQKSPAGRPLLADLFCHRSSANSPIRKVAHAASSRAAKRGVTLGPSAPSWLWLLPKTPR